jgi:hypothetical protein
MSKSLSSAIGQTTQGNRVEEYARQVIARRSAKHSPFCAISRDHAVIVKKPDRLRRFRQFKDGTPAHD